MSLLDEAHTGDLPVDLRLEIRRMVDKDGDVRAALGLMPDGPGLELINDNHKTRARLMADKEKTRLVLNDDNGKPIWSAP